MNCVLVNPDNAVVDKALIFVVPRATKPVEFKAFRDVDTRPDTCVVVSARRFVVPKPLNWVDTSVTNWVVESASI